MREWKASGFGLPAACQDHDTGAEDDKGGPDSDDDSNAELASRADGDDMELDSLDNQLLSELEREIPAPEQEARKGAPFLPSVARRGPDVGNGLRRGTDGRSGLRKKVIVSNCTQGKLKVEKSGSKVKLVDLSVDRSGHVRVQCGAAH